MLLAEHETCFYQGKADSLSCAASTRVRHHVLLLLPSFLADFSY